MWPHASEEAVEFGVQGFGGVYSAEGGFDEAEAFHPDSVVPLAVEGAQVCGVVVELVYHVQHGVGYIVDLSGGGRQIAVWPSYGCLLGAALAAVVFVEAAFFAGAALAVVLALPTRSFLVATFFSPCNFKRI
jgi:hypothetical protein